MSSITDLLKANEENWFKWINKNVKTKNNAIILEWNDEIEWIFRPLDLIKDLKLTFVINNTALVYMTALIHSWTELKIYLLYHEFISFYILFYCEFNSFYI